MKSVEGHLQVTGGKIWYRVFPSKKKKTPLIVLHGGPGSSSHSMLTLNKFSKDRTVVFYDQLGSGQFASKLRATSSKTDGTI
jgi:proline iminopeptidase